jgi:ribosomal protein S18 acetylase RimI-like enzyme
MSALVARETDWPEQLVEAQPKHASFIAWVTLTAFRSHLERGFWDIQIDRSEEETLRFLEALVSTRTRHWASLSNFIVAEIGGKPVAALSGYFERDSDTLGGMEEANRAVGRSADEARAGWERARSISLCAPRHEEGAWIVENVATLPEYRRRGLIDRLTARILEIGAERGANTAEVGVFIDNDPAQRAYEKSGFVVVDERRHPEFEAVYKTPGIRLLRRSI